MELKHVVVLMLENRSFDHLLGYLDHPSSAFPNLRGNEDNPDPSPQPGQPARAKVSKDASRVITPGPGHHHRDVMRQIYHEGAYGQDEPDNLGFVSNFHEQKRSGTTSDPGAAVMRCMSPEKIPVLAALAKHYAVCVNWHSSVPGMTWPNRGFAHTGTSEGEVDIVKKLYWATTIFKRLSKAAVPWAIYHDGVPHTWVYPKLWERPFDRKDKFRSMRTFHRQAERGELPAYSFIEPNHLGSSSNSQHPEYIGRNPEQFVDAERLIKSVYESLTSNQSAWKNTLFLITYDEHGGFFDRKPPPAAVPPSRRNKGSFKFNRLGCRVPAVVVSPWIPRGKVDFTLYDHTSIIKSVQGLFAPASRHLTERDKHANSFMHLCQLAAPRTDLVDLPDLPRPKNMRKNMGPIKPELDEFQQSLIWLAQRVTEASEPDELAATQVMSKGLKPPPAEFKSTKDLDDFQSTAVKLFRSGGVGKAKAPAAKTMPKQLSPKEFVKFQKSHYGNLSGASDFETRYAQFKKQSLQSKKGAAFSVLTEGDSWFAFPSILGRKNVIERIQDEFSEWRFLRMEDNGDELAAMLSGKQRARIREVLSDKLFDLLLFSGGGNDVVGDDMTALLNDYRPGMSLEDCINGDRFERRLTQIELSYRDLVDIRNDNSPATIVVVNGYDYPHPRNEGVCRQGPWLYPGMMRRGIEDPDLQMEIAVYLIDRFNDALRAVVDSPLSRGTVHLAPTVGTLMKDEWGDEIHPSRSGFKLIARKFQEVFEEIGIG
jgi:phospholipase C